MDTTAVTGREVGGRRDRTWSGASRRSRAARRPLRVPVQAPGDLVHLTLGFYVIFATVLWARSYPWYRVWAMAFVVAATLFALTMIEPPQQIWGTWADNVSRPAPLFTPDGSKNQLNVESPLLGVLAIVEVMLLQAAMIGALVLFIGEARRGRPRADRSATRAPGSL
jgi:hypothetical protein